MKILPSTYLPSIEIFRAIATGDYIVDLGEHYIKRSERNRAEIMTAGGVMQLTVNICRANRPRTPMRQIEIDYSKRWQHQHWMAIISAYKSSPFFDHYEPYLRPLFERRFSTLMELNTALTEQIMKLLGIATPLRVSTTYIDAKEEDRDLRPKKRDVELPEQPYIQVFSDRYPFAANLSILDLLFCEGPNALTLLLHP